MPFNQWWAPLITQQAAASAVTGTTSQTSVLNGQAKFTLAAEYLQYVGQKLHIKAGGVMTTAASSPGTMIWTVVFGAINVFGGGTTPTLATSQTGVPWSLDIDLTVRTVGSSTAATIAGSGTFNTLGLSSSIYVLNVPGSLTGFDSTIANVVDLQVTPSASTLSVTCHQYELAG
jgi:hypothetical protein